MGKKPRLLLLDANAVFAAYRFGVWEGLCSAYDIVLPSTIVRVEALFYVSRDSGARISLDLPDLVANGTISEVAVDPTEVAALRSRFDHELRERIDRGEAEAIAYVLAHSDEDLRFVTSDGSALEPSARWASPTVRCA